MSTLARLAVGSLQPGVDPQVAIWALREGLGRNGIQVQSYLSRACFPRNPAETSLTGLTVRHLDSWLMSPEICRDIFVRGARTADLAIVEGRFGPAADRDLLGGKLEPLCEWLDLPQIVILDVSKIGHCCLPDRPDRADALFLDKVGDAEEAARLATEFEALWGIPVVGAVERLPRVQA